MKKLSKVVRESLESRGFTVSETTGRIYCEACEACAINGMNCHESGCPRQTFVCKGCDARVPRRGAYCQDCA